jgi:hypothetical protein
MLAATPLAATMSVPRIIGSLVGGYAGDKAGRYIARQVGVGDTGQEIAGDVGGLVGGGIGGHRLNTGVRSFRTSIVDALRPEPTYPGAPLPASPSTGEFVESAPATPPGPPIARGEVVPPKLLPASASVARDLPYRMGPGEVAPEDVNAPDPFVLGGRGGVRVPARMTPRLLSSGTEIGVPSDSPPPVSSLYPPVTENPFVGNLARAMQKSGVPMGDRPSLLLKGSGRVNRILSPEEDLTDALAKSARLARRQRKH